MRRNRELITYIIFGLIAIGILASFVNNPAPMIIPLLVFGLVFYLYKFPPGWLRGMRGRSKSAAKPPRPAQKPKTTRKNSPFRVIKGNKRDDDDEPPRYH